MQKGKRTSVYTQNIIKHLTFLVGSALYAFSFVYFINPNEISPGGFTGIAAILNYLFNFPVGITLFFLNVPILILGFLKIGGGMVFGTMLVTVYTSVFIDFFDSLNIFFTGERILAALFGGFLMGLGLSIIMLQGATTGGVDIIAKLINQKNVFLSIGRLILVLDVIVVFIAMLCYKNIETALFTMVTLFVSSKIIDVLLYGTEECRFLFIISHRCDIISKEIYDNIGRGSTFIDIKGGYEKQKGTMLLCSVRKNEVRKTLAIIKENDADAFTVVTLSGGVFGNGFDKKEN